MDVGSVTGSTMYMGMKSERTDRTMEPASDDFAPKVLPYEKAQCTLHISEEGYRRWELAQQSVKAYQTDNEQLSSGTLQLSSGITQDVAETLPEEAMEVCDTEPKLDRATKILQFLDAYRDLHAHLKPKASKDTDKEKVEAMEQLRQLEEEQEAEYRKQEAEAQAIAKKRMKTQNTVERGMRELTIMLESVKPQEEESEKEKTKTSERKGGQKDRAQDTVPDRSIGRQDALLDQTKGQQDTTLDRKEGQQNRMSDQKGKMDFPDTRETMRGLGRQIKNHAFRTERAMDVTIARIYESAQSNFETARDEDNGLLSRFSSLSDMLEQTEAPEEDKDAAVDQFLMEAQISFGMIRDYMGFGLERLNNLRALRIGRLSNQNMVYASRVQDHINNLADQTALDERYRESFKKLENANLEKQADYIRKLQEERRPDADEAEREKKEEENSAGDVNETKKEENEKERKED